VTLPAVKQIRRNDTHRLIPSKYSTDESVLADLAGDDADLQKLFDLDHATNDRLLAVPYFRIVNAAFCHAHPLGSRFNGPDRGAWYAAFDLKTAQAEIAFHKSIELAEVDWTDEEVTYDDYLADFSGELHDIRGDKRFTDVLAPHSYVASQRLAQDLLDAGSLGIVYPSVRRRNGTCLACFRPALVMNVRKARTYTFRWEGRSAPSVSIAG
jgi:hypothetical protein